MGAVTLITGGSRSGKSRHALRLAEGIPGPRTFIATCPPVDGEMRQRIARHRRERRAAQWETVEAEMELAPALGRTQGVALVDCLTLWVSNLMFSAEAARQPLSEDDVARSAEAVVAAARERSGPTIFVTNEVGMGIVPDNAAARRFRDLAGRCNQTVAAAADTVVLMVSGVAVGIKAPSHRPVHDERGGTWSPGRETAH